jgi:hypothetical protein
MGVDLGRGETLVAQQFLDDSKVRPSVEEMRGKAMAEGVGRNTLRQARGASELLQAPAYAPSANGAPPMIQE